MTAATRSATAGPAIRRTTDVWAPRAIFRVEAVKKIRGFAPLAFDDFTDAPLHGDAVRAALGSGRSDAYYATRRC